MFQRYAQRGRLAPTLIAEGRRRLNRVSSSHWGFVQYNTSQAAHGRRALLLTSRRFLQQCNCKLYMSAPIDVACYRHCVMMCNHQYCQGSKDRDRKQSRAGRGERSDAFPFSAHWRRANFEFCCHAQHELRALIQRSPGHSWDVLQSAQRILWAMVQGSPVLADFIIYICFFMDAVCDHKQYGDR